jgi:hypothetical protein
MEQSKDSEEILNAAPTDALGNPVVIGQKYGYSQQSNGSVMVVTGVVEKFNDLKATLKDVEERKGMWGSISNPFTFEKRKRAVNACHLFPVLDAPIITDWNDLQLVDTDGNLNEGGEDDGKYGICIRRNYLKANYPNGVIVKQIEK